MASSKRLELQQQLGIAEDGFRAVGTERKGLAEGEIGLLQQPLILGVGLGTILRRTLRTEAPGVNAADGAAQLGEGLLRVVIVEELAVAGEAVEIAAQVGLLDPIGDLLEGRVVVNDVAGQPLGELLPELVVAIVGCPPSARATAGG